MDMVNLKDQKQSNYLIFYNYNEKVFLYFPPKIYETIFHWKNKNQYLC